MDFIPYGRQNISDEDISSVVSVLKSEYITQGPVLKEFEIQFSKVVGSKYATAVNSATSALHIACLALGVGKGDSVWTTPNSFVASSNAALYCGASIHFVDIDIQTFNMSTSLLEKKLIQAKKNNSLPKVVIPVHFGGSSCDMEAISILAREYDFKIIEDASHAVGASYKGKHVGSCEFSDIAVYSFHPVKILTTAEGGMCFTNDDDIYNSLSKLRTHGITREQSDMTESSHGGWYYQQTDLGFNYRMTDIQAALGLSQLSRLKKFVERRNEKAEYYLKKLRDFPVATQLISPDSISSYHLMVILFDDKDKRLHAFNFLRESNIGVNIHYIPIHTQPYYRNLGFREGDFPISEEYYSRCISLPLFPDLKDSEIDYICEKLKEVM